MGFREKLNLICLKAGDDPAFLRLAARSLFFCVVLSTVSCMPGMHILELTQVKNWDHKGGDQILFLEFLIRDGESGKHEKVELIKAIAGKGKMKNLGAHVQNPFQIQVVPRYKVSAMELPVSYEHPLHAQMEVSDSTGLLTRVKTDTKEGRLNVRMQADPHIDRIELFSIAPEKGSVKIYTLQLKP
jgi:hypothetical protein